MSEKRADISAALQTAAKGYDAFTAAATPGASEMTLHAAVLRAAGMSAVGFDMLSGPRTAGIEGSATERMLQRGDALLLDLCLKHGQHWCDVCRTYFLGEPAPAMAAAYEAVLDCSAHVRGLLRDGVAASKIYAAAEAFLAARGLSGWLRHHTGHGIGRTPFEAPVAVAHSLDTLRLGDVVTVEIGVYLDGAFGIRVEDDFCITPEGAESLWHYPKTLTEVILPWPER